MTLRKAKALLEESDRTGRPIQERVSDGWTNVDSDMTLDRHDSAYRVAPPEPLKPREIWRRNSEVGHDFVTEEHRKQLLSKGYVLFREVLPEVKS